MLFLFVLVDVWYYVRCAVFLVPYRTWQAFFPKRMKKVTRKELLSVTEMRGLVLPSDLDFQFHMNNSKYLREMDFGRIYHFISTNFYRCVLGCGGNLLLGATMIRYRRSLQLWQRFSLQTRILCWVDDAVYVEQRFLNHGDGFVCAIALLKMSTKGVKVNQVLERLCTDGTQSPPFPPHVKSWAETIEQSRDCLKQEKGTQ